MFKKLRNRFLIVNMLIIAALLLGSFSVIYITTYQYTNRNINEKLERSIGFAMDDRMQRDGMRRDMAAGEGAENGEPIPPKGDMAPPEGAQNGEIPPPDDGMRRAGDRDMSGDMFSLTFNVQCDADGNITKANIPFELGEDFYTERMSEFIASERGTLKSDSGYWAYKSVKTENGYVTAFTQINSEQTVM